MTIENAIRAFAGTFVLVSLALGVQVPELVDARERDIGICVVHHRRSLEISCRQHLGLEIQRAPAEIPVQVAKVPIQRAGIDDRDLANYLGLAVEEVGV